MKEHYIYIHRRNDTGEVFYVGKGSGKRAFDKKRNDWWKRIVSKCGYTVEIIEWFDDHDSALAREVELIAEYREKGVQLVNLTDGGEGAKGYKHTPETRKIMSIKHIGKTPSDETKKKLSLAKKGEKHHMFGKITSIETKRKISATNKDRTHSHATKMKISSSQKGEKNHMFGKTVSEETREKQRVASTGRFHSKETKDKISVLKIRNKYIQLDILSGEIIAEYVGYQNLKKRWI